MPISSFALIAANLIPLVGVLFFAWDHALVLALFWIENLLIGAFNVIRILSVSLLNKQPAGLLLCAFFIFHYGAFCSVHGMLLIDLIGFDKVDYQKYFALQSSGILKIFLQGAAVLLSFVERLSPAIYFGIVALALSHLVSFIENFVLRGEIYKLDGRKLMARPYEQIFIMHAGLIFGAFLLQKYHSPIWLLVVMVLLKLMLDFLQHRRRHRQMNEQQTQIKDF